MAFWNKKLSLRIFSGSKASSSGLKGGANVQFGSRRSFEAWKPYYIWGATLLVCLVAAAIIIPTSIAGYHAGERQLEQNMVLLQKLEKKLAQEAGEGETQLSSQARRFQEYLENPVSPSQAASRLDEAFGQVKGAEQVSYRVLRPMEEDDYVLHPFQYIFRADVMQLYELFQAVESVPFPVVLQDLKVSTPRSQRRDESTLDVDMTIALVVLPETASGSEVKQP